MSFVTAQQYNSLCYKKFAYISLQMKTEKILETEYLPYSIKRAVT